jgi:hypothetical protein
MRNGSLAIGMLLLTAVAAPALAQDGGSVRVGATVTITMGALGESVGGRLEFVRGIAGSLNAIADRSRSPLERRADEESRAWVASLASRLSSHVERRDAALSEPGRTLAEIRADSDRLDAELAALATGGLAEAAAVDPDTARPVIDLLRSLL